MRKGHIEQLLSLVRLSAVKTRSGDPLPFPGVGDVPAQGWAIGPGCLRTALSLGTDRRFAIERGLHVEEDARRRCLPSNSIALNV